ncbi:MAG: efflux RND transporter permease subunit [Bacteroidota bacterium]
MSTTQPDNTSPSILRGFINYFIKNPIAGNLLMIGLFLIGILGLMNMKSTFFPEEESKLISIRVPYLGASPEEIEEGVVNKIEENLRGLTGVDRITSISAEDLGSVSVEVAKGYDTDIILQDVKNTVDRINSFPVDIEPPVIYKLENLGFAISFALSGNVDLKTLKKFGRKAEEDLLAVDGISKVELSGFPDEEIEISFREQDLQAYKITFTQATQAVRVANLEITGGTVKGKQEELLVRARNKKYYADELRDIVLKTSADGSVVRLHEVADIRDQWADNPNRSFINGEPSVVVTIQNTLEEDMLTITDTVKNYITAFNAENDIIKATIIRDGSIVLKQRISLLTENGIIGFIIVLILLAMFLNWRLAFWVALSIPISFAGMFICVSMLGITVNVISLFGMILVIGILVDDGIVIGENIYQKFENGMPRMQAAIEGTMSVLPAVFSAILTTLIVFSTFYFLDGRLGDLFEEMASVVIFSLIFSLVEGALILPAHVAHSKALSPNRKRNPVSVALDNFMIWMRDKLYAPVLNFAMYNKFLTISVIVGAMIVTFGALSGELIQTTFFPNIERDNISVTLKMPAGTREQFTERWLNHIEASAWEINQEFKKEYFDGAEDVILKIEKIVGPSSYEGTLNITLLDGETRDTVSSRKVSNAIRDRVGDIYDAEQLSFGADSPFGRPVSVSLVGDNYRELNEATDEVKEALSSLTELKDVADNNQEGLREINISLKEKGLFLGLNLQEVVSQVRQGFFGSEIQRLQRGRDEVKVWVRYDLSNRRNISDLEDMRIRFADGREFPLDEIATLNIERGIISISHLDGKREVKIDADVSNDDVSVSAITASIQGDIVPAILQNYPSVEALYEGQNREQTKSSESLQTVLPIILLLMFFTIALTFRSVSQTIVVLALIPFGLIGVAWGHYIMGAPISLFSILGVIALAGVLVNDALVFVTAFNDQMKQGKPYMEAVRDAGLSRFRPILLTTLTTFAGLGPLLFEKSFQAQFLIPMAISVAFGLLVVTGIILILLPVLLIISNRIKVYSLYLWEGEKPSYEIVEPAVENRKNYFFLWLIAAIMSASVFIGIINVLFKLIA